MAKKKPNKSAVPIYRHTEPPKSVKMASYECKFLDDIERHIAQFIGKEEDVLHEIISETVHVDLHVIKPSERVPYLTLVTSGMSDLRMKVPGSLKNPEEYELAEIISFLPPDWPIDAFIGNDDAADLIKSKWYPASWMKHYARMPHEHKTFLTWGHTTANGEPAEPIEDGLGMVGFLFAPPLQLGAPGLFVESQDGKRIRLLNMVPLWPDELSFAVKYGGEALCDKLDRAENFVFNPNRQSCMTRKKLFGLF